MKSVLLKKIPGRADRPGKNGAPSKILYTERFRQEKIFGRCQFVKSPDRAESRTDPESVLIARSKGRILAHQ